jgi:hypothetical protein
MNTQSSLREKKYKTPKASTVSTQATYAKETVYSIHFGTLRIYPQQFCQPTNTSI